MLSFFCLSLLYFITFFSSFTVICKFPQFMTEAKAAKLFYFSILLICFVRSTCFGVATIFFVDEFKIEEQHAANKSSEVDLFAPSISLASNSLTELVNEQSIFEVDNSAINKIPRILVLLILSPEYLVIFAYLILVWLLQSYYYDGYAENFIQMFWNGRGQCNVILLSSLLFLSQVVFTGMYILKMIQAQDLIFILMAINCILPVCVTMVVLYFKCQFSGIPKREEFKSRLKKLQWAVAIWTVMRLGRAVTSIWDINILFGMMIDITQNSPEKFLDYHKDINIDDSTILVLPMLLIVIFLLFEIWPIWVVLDGNFIDIFLKQSVLIVQKDLMSPLLHQEDIQR